MAVIDDFSGEFFFLSNFYVHRFWWNGLFWRSSEHAYQAAKTFDEKWVTKIQLAQTPGESKKLGRKAPMRNDWDRVKIPTMYDILKVKFDDPKLKEMLLATEDAELVEGNTWGDTFWGVCRGRGQNHLGKVLMKIRKEYSNK